ncbi:MAG: response regulator [Candidatus Thiodiazotropha sp. (ex Monitilora ramsayi)]|nr:response regulator [Candidatus Thiodiazotropha sp. (ex Monitilora ramsayi)]
MARLFWVEDQTHWIDKFTEILQTTDFDGSRNSLEIFKFPAAAKQRIVTLDEQSKPDIAILDAHMNGSDQAGFSVSRALRKRWPQLPIIYLSEHSGTKLEKQAFEQANAEDFIAKHQRNIEAVLCWRIKAALKKSRQQSTGPDDTIESGSLRIDLVSWEVYWKGVKLMNPHNPKRPLAPTPRKILRYLVQRSPRALTTDQVVELLDADPERFSYANYRQHIKTLRSAFELAEGNSGHFNALCKEGRGIVTFGDLHAYSWKPDKA